MFYKLDYIFLGKLFLRLTNYCFFICSLCQSDRSAPLSGGIMDKKIIYLKLFQIVLTLIIIWQLLSLRQFCGTFANPKTFLHETINHCNGFSLIGKDSKTGEFNSMFNKLFNQFFKGRPTAEQKHQFKDELAAKLPSAGRHCIPITISPFYWFFEWVRLYINPLNNGTLFHFSKLFSNALVSLGFLGIVIMEMLRSVEEYYSSGILLAFFSVIGWGYSVVYSFNLLFFWSHFWTCFNFQADRTIVPFDTLVLSIVMVCLYVFELFYRIRDIATYVIEEDDE